MWEYIHSQHRHTYFANHSSSKLDPIFIDSYIASEQVAGRYSEAFAPQELERLIGPFRSSPLGLVPKPNSDKMRLIQDLSFPRDDGHVQSINAGISASDFPTAWGTFDATSALILSLPKGCLAATFDISAAYRLTPIRPAQQNALCVFWKDKVYVDRAVMFGLASGAGVFGSIADMLVAIYVKSGFGPLLKWVDDFFAIKLPEGTWTEQEFIELTASIGVPWSAEKLRRLAAIQRYIGFDWDLAQKLVALPEEKLDKTLQLIDDWSKASTRTASQAAKLHGKLVHISCIFPLIRPFLQSISGFAQGFRSQRAKLIPPPALIADLSWVRFVLQQSPNQRPLYAPEPVDIGWWGDASSSFGIGIVIGTHWAIWKWTKGFRVGPKQDCDIGWAEAVAVELGLRAALELGYCKPKQDARNTFIVRSDNAGVVAVTNKGRSKSKETNHILKHVYQLQATNAIRISATYVPSRDNIADALSRGDVNGFLRGFPDIHHRIEISLPPHLRSRLTAW